MKHIFKQTVNPLDDQLVREDIESLPDHITDPNKPYKNTKLYKTRDYLNGQQICSMAAVLLEHNHEVTRVIAFKNQLETEMRKNELTDINLDDPNIDIGAVYQHFKMLNLPSNNGSHFWRAAWGVFTGYMDIVDKNNMIADWHKQDIMGRFFV